VILWESIKTSWYLSSMRLKTVNSLEKLESVPDAGHLWQSTKIGIHAVNAGTLNL